VAEGDRRGDPEAAARAADRARARTIDQPDRSLLLQPDGARRRLRRKGGPAERLLHLYRRSGLVQRGPGPLPRPVGQRHHRRRGTVPAARQACGADGGTGEKTVTPLQRVPRRDERMQTRTTPVPVLRGLVSSWLIRSLAILA